MLISPLLGRLWVAETSFVFTRSKAAVAVTDPVQQLFLEKIREYKKKSPDGKLVDPSPEIENEMKTELAKLENRYGGGPGVDMSLFPSFKFVDHELDPIDEKIPIVQKKTKN